MDKKQFTKRVQEQFKGKVHGDLVADIVGFVFDEIVNVVAGGDEVHINRLGRFHPLPKNKKVVRSPVTPQKQHVAPARVHLAFKPAQCANKVVNTAHQTGGGARPRHSGADPMDWLS